MPATADAVQMAVAVERRDHAPVSLGLAAPRGDRDFPCPYLIDAMSEPSVAKPGTPVPKQN
jgi:hypothetical protein